MSDELYTAWKREVADYVDVVLENEHDRIEAMIEEYGYTNGAKRYEEYER